MVCRWEGDDEGQSLVDPATLRCCSWARGEYFFLFSVSYHCAVVVIVGSGEGACEESG